MYDKLLPIRSIDEIGQAVATIDKVHIDKKVSHRQKNVNFVPNGASYWCAGMLALQSESRARVTSRYLDFNTTERSLVVSAPDPTDAAA